MRIGMILDKKFPPDPRVENEAISLINKGHEVFLFCLKYNKNDGDVLINGIQVKRYHSNKLEYKLSALAYTFPFYTYLMKQKIVHFLNKYKIETIHIHDIRIAGAVYKATKIITVSQEFIEEVVGRTKIARDKIVLVPNTVHQSFYNDAVIDKLI